MKALFNNITQAYEIVGTGTPVLWIHGFPIDRTLWKPQAVALADCALHIMPDLRGFGESDAPAGTYTMDLYADDMRKLLDHLGIEKAIIAGLSMGGYVALAFARKYPDRMMGLMLFDTRAVGDTPEGAKGRRESAQRVLREGVAAVVVEPMIPKLVSPRTQTDKPKVVADLRALLLSSRPQGVAGALLGLADRIDSTPYLSSIKVPTLIIVGTDDVITPPAESRKMADLIPDATLVEIPNAGHVPNLEQPEAFNNAVRSFLKRF